MSAINADAAYVLGYTGLGSRVGVIDQPVWLPHPEFAATVGGAPKLTFVTTSGTYVYADPYITTREPGVAFTYDGTMYVDGRGSVADHGTHVGGIAAANRDTTASAPGRMQGVAYNARIFAADNGDPGPEDGVVLGNDGNAYGAAWQAMIDSEVAVITNSWGIGIIGSPWSYPEAAAQFGEIAAALGTPGGGAYDGVIEAARSDIVIEFSAGNDYGDEPDAIAGLPAFIPELEENWVTTMSVARNLRRSSFSSICGYTKYWCVAAPGSGIFSAEVDADLNGKTNGDLLPDAQPSYGLKSGTSMSGPFVSGSIAVLKERFPYLSNAALATILKTTSTDLGEAGVDAVYGWGLIDLDTAMDGPGQLLGRFEASLPGGVGDVWSNDISDAALQQRQAEDLAEIASGGPRAPMLSAKSEADYLGSLVKSGDGVLRLTGTNTYRGDTTIDGGLLVVDGSLASRTVVNDGGVLGGSGAVGELVANAGAIVSPGKSIGTLTVGQAGAIGDGAGNATFQKESTLAIEVAADGRSDQLLVDGRATLLGGVVMVSLENAAGPADAAALASVAGNRFAVLDAQGGVEGTFEGVADPYRFVGTSLIYGAGTVDLAVERRAFVEAGETFNQRQAAAAVETLGTGDAIYDRLLGLRVGEDAPAILASLTGEVHASLQSALVQDGRFLRDAAASRTRATLGGIVTTTAAGPGGQGGTAPGLWGEVFGARGSFDGDGNAGELDRDIGGFLAGIDGEIADAWRLGLIAGYGDSELDGTGFSADVDTYQIGVYGGARWDAVGLSLGAAYGRHDIETSRLSWFGPATADYDADSVQVFGEAGYTLDTALAAFEPFAGLAYTHLKTDGFREGGGASALSGSGDSSDTTVSTLGLRTSRQFVVDGGMPATISGAVAWRHAFDDVVPETSLAFAGGGAFVSRGVAIAEDALALEAGIGLDITPNAQVGLRYNGQFGDGFTDNSLLANIDVKF